MPASAASNSAAVCDTSANSKPLGASSRAIAPASADGGTRTILGIASSLPRVKADRSMHQSAQAMPTSSSGGGASQRQAAAGQWDQGNCQRTPGTTSGLFGLRQTAQIARAPLP